MPIDVVGKTEVGERVKWIDSGRAIDRASIQVCDDPSFHFLRFVDPYDNTIFNQVQIGALLEEFARVDTRAWSPEEREGLTRVEAAARECVAQRRWYLWFIGD
jgi:hypothetical protein